MISFPHAKINLGLNIVAKRADGYHLIETVFFPLDTVCDALEINPAVKNTTTFRQKGLPVDGDPEQNLVMKAYRLLARRYVVPKLDICLFKNIPFGAGLGGGSSDAAFMLKMLNKVTELDLQDDELEVLAAELGADCPFFIRSRPVFASGIGNVFEDIKLSLDDYEISVVKPEVNVSTREAYSRVKIRQPEVSIKDIIRLAPEKWRGLLVNDFEESVFALYPEIGEIKEDMYSKGAVYASMSGSGSAVYGLFRKSSL